MRDAVRMVPVPDGTRKLRYTAVDYVTRSGPGRNYVTKDRVLPMLKLPDPVDIKVAVNPETVALYVGPRDWNWDRSSGKMIGQETMVNDAAKDGTLEWRTGRGPTSVAELFVDGKMVGFVEKIGTDYYNGEIESGEHRSFRTIGAAKSWILRKTHEVHGYDGLATNAFAALGALVALWALLHRGTADPGDYDLMTYKPKPREW